MHKSVTVESEVINIDLVKNDKGGSVQRCCCTVWISASNIHTVNYVTGRCML